MDEVLTIKFWSFSDEGKRVHVEEDYIELPEKDCNPVDKIGKMGDPGFWLWICDYKEHKSNVTKRNYPKIIIPTLIHMWGTEEDAKAIGYRKMHRIAHREYPFGRPRK